MKVHHSLNGIGCDKMSTAVTAVKTHPNRYEKDFDIVVVYLLEYEEK